MPNTLGTQKSAFSRLNHDPFVGCEMTVVVATSIFKIELQDYIKIYFMYSTILHTVMAGIVLLNV